MKIVLGVPVDLLPALSVAKNLMVLVLCARLAKFMAQLPVASALVVAVEKSLLTVELASAAPEKVIVVVEKN